MEIHEDNADELTAPLQFFIELSVYTSLVSKPDDSKIEYKKFQGAQVPGVSWLLKEVLS